MKRRIILMTILTAFAATGAQAVAITPNLSFLPGSTLNTTGLASFTTGGANMDGMSVTAYFAGGTSQSAVWSTTGVNTGAATGTNWSLSMSGVSSYSTPWTLVNSSSSPMTRLLIDGQPGSTIFDVALEDYSLPDRNWLTPGSAQGIPMSAVDGPADLAINAIYSNQVALNNLIYGDLYTVLDIHFLDGLIGELSYIADTDNTSIAGDITPIEVPEPTSVALFGLALAGLFAANRRRG